MSASSLQIMPVETEIQYQQVRQLIEVYASWRNFDEALTNLHKELDHLSDYYPLILLAYWQGQPAGCVALQLLEAGICEMKRLYVDTAYRSHGVGYGLVRTLIERAEALGFRCMRLDTHPQMFAAQKLYHSLGFREIRRYNQNPIPGIRFFELQLEANSSTL